MSVIIGIDPGLTGAICILGGGYQEVIDIPTCSNGQESGSMREWLDATELRIIMRELRQRRVLLKDFVSVYIERPITMPNLPSQTIAAQFDTFGALRASMAQFQRVRIINPRDWKKLYGVGADKDKARETAANLYPNLKPLLQRVKDHNRADAVLIAQYGRREME